MGEQNRELDQSSKKPVYNRRLFWIIAIPVFLVIVAAASSSPNTSQTTNPKSTSEAATKEETKKSSKPSVPAEYTSALAQAETYANEMHFSKQGVYDQLTSEYGGKFTKEAAQYAIDNVKADWNANALAQAKTYQNEMHLSTASVHDQLTSEYGAKFTQEEADYAISHLND